MSNKEEDKLENAIIALHKEMKGMRGDMKTHQAKTNLAIGELRVSYMKLDESFNRYAELNEARLTSHETRITRLEDKTRGSSYSVSGPSAKYKIKKGK